MDVDVRMGVSDSEKDMDEKSSFSKNFKQFKLHKP